MLPTTGHFKVINCPFYDTCICERPYCHFKHSKKETGKDEEQVISELVSQAVHKVLNPELPDEITSDDKPGENDDIQENQPEEPPKLTYNPTPISELNKIKNNSTETIPEVKKVKRHIPIQYTPQRPQTTRQNGYSSAKSESKLYTPIGTVTNTDILYTPSSIKDLLAESEKPDDKSYIPENTATSHNSGSVTYNPTAIDSENETKASNFEYTPTSVTDTATVEDDLFDLGSADYLDDFLNDPNLYETNEELSENGDKKTSEQLSDSGKNCEKSDNIIKLLNGATSSKHSDSKSKSSKSSDSSKKHSKHSDKSKSKHSDSKSSRKSGKGDKREKSRHEYSKTKRKDSSSSKELHNNSSSKESSSTSKDHSSSKEHKSSKEKHSTSKSHHSSSKSSSSKHLSSKNKDKKSSRSSSSTERNSSSKSSSKHHSSSKTTTAKSPESSEVKESVLKESVSNQNVSLSMEEMDLLHEDDMFDYDSDDPTTSMEECKKIFEEYMPPEVDNEESQPVFSKPMDEDPNSLPQAKKRVAHEKHYKSLFTSVPKPTLKKSIESPAQVMVRRYQLMKEQANKLAKENNSTPPTIEQSPVPGVKRIARVPNVSSLINAKKKVEELIKEKSMVPKTPSQTVAKGDKRTSHVPDISSLDIPMVLQADKSRLPINVRTRFLQMMVNECSKLYSSKESIFERALNEELNCYTRCSVLGTYRNSAMLAVNRLRKEHDMTSQSGSGSNISILKKRQSTDIASELSGSHFYNNISRWILTQEQLEQNGFPLPGSRIKGHAIFKDGKVYETFSENNHRCARCKKIYFADEHGYPMIKEDCIYHPSGRFTYRGETKFICCRGPPSEEGCCSSNTHVFEIPDPSKLGGFVTTFEPSGSSDKRSGLVVALDCEMVYTTRGMELARVTVVNNNCDTIYESLVKPSGDILDCNTRFSGLTDDMLKKATKRITDVQAALLLMFNSKTILIGHSLESDLKAMRLIHPTIIDTSVLFPHKLGPPKKRSLRNLASDMLQKIIQNSESGHDSAEDAITCMELIIWKLKEELKTR